MSLLLTKSVEVFEGNGSSTEFPTNIYAFEADQITVELIGVAGGTEELVHETDYTLSNLGAEPLAGIQLGIVVTMIVAPASGERIRVRRKTENVQPIEISLGGFDPQIIEQQFDLLTMMQQETASKVDRSFKLADPELELEDLPTPVDGAILVGYRSGNTYGFTFGPVVSLFVNFAEAVEDVQEAATEVEEDRVAAELASATAVEHATNWTGAWFAGTVYEERDLAQSGGSTYLCLEGHLAGEEDGTFATDLGLGYWEVVAARGQPGAGTGDVLVANQGNEYDPAQFKTNLGFGSAGNYPRATTEESISGTEDTIMDAAQVRARIIALTTRDILIEDQKSSGTDGGSSVAGSYRVRQLNTVRRNNISGVSLASNAVTLPPGTYYITASAPSYSSGAHKAAITETDGTILIHGAVSIGSTSESMMTVSTIEGFITLESQIEIQLRHMIGVSRPTNGLGLAAGFGGVEVYSRLHIWKIN